MIKIEYPEAKPSIKTVDNKEYIFCILRRRWMVLTPEEWVRQNFLLFLLEKCDYQKSLMAVERLIKIGELSQRFDIVIFDKEAKPWMVVECKEMDETIGEKTLHQVLRYNSQLQAPYFVITNGITTYIYVKSKNSFEEIKAFP